MKFLDDRSPSQRLLMVVVLMPIAVIVAGAVVWLATLVREIPAVESFILRYPGELELPEGTREGIPPWVGITHFVNMLFMLLIIRTGWQIRTGAKPDSYWTRNNAGPLRTKYPPTKISLTLWTHLVLDVLWITNGIVYIVLLLVSGHWARVIPTSWEVFPHSISVALQYASFDWPSENGWINYNSLQVLAYFVTIFVAAPLAIVTGVRMSPAWSPRFRALERIYPVTLARVVHFPVMLYFVAFTVAHVTLVLATGALRNLNHMYASRDEVSWVGALIFAGSLMIMATCWLLLRPMLLRPVALLGGQVTKR
ncbi:cytochrome b/b6 domain-containing protein [Microcella sp.]|uniref:cytochrome b/b6 domain-containing protein n=1 Tax=Microcella sp. TaxID=1913979 RepID=UPI00256B3277|nr:cytochrome b/b6 domain-containing protein [Microcella sp.]MBX9472387.1 cytochrome b/b6 domain-containing protein [Microcella sp.]